MGNPDAKTLERIERALQKALNRDPSKYDTEEDEDIVIDAYNAMHDIELHSYVELIDYLYKFVTDRDEYLREKAIASFGGFTGKQVMAAKEIAFRMWNNKEEDSDVRFSALTIWRGFYKNSKNKEAASILFSLIKDKTAPSDLKINAYEGLLNLYENKIDNVELDWFLKMAFVEDPIVFENSLDWNRIYKIMKECDPEFSDER